MSIKHFARRLPAVALLVALVSFGAVPSAWAQVSVWSTNGPSGDTVFVVAVDPQTSSTPYAGTMGRGLFKSTDAGAEWDTLDAGVPNLEVRDVAVASGSQTIIYVGAFELGWSIGGVLKTTDGGRTRSRNRAVSRPRGRRAEHVLLATMIRAARSRYSRMAVREDRILTPFADTCTLPLFPFTADPTTLDARTNRRCTHEHR